MRFRADLYQPYQPLIREGLQGEHDREYYKKREDQERIFRMFGDPGVLKAISYGAKVSIQKTCDENPGVYGHLDETFTVMGEFTDEQYTEWQQYKMLQKLKE